MPVGGRNGVQARLDEGNVVGELLQVGHGGGLSVKEVRVGHVLLVSHLLQLCVALL